MRKVNLLFITFLIIYSSASAEHVGKVYIHNGIAPPKTIFQTQSTELISFINSEIEIGNLQLQRLDQDPLVSMEHHRYIQYHKGLEVFGGYIVKHYKNEGLISINGEYYSPENIVVEPILSRNAAIKIFREYLGEGKLKAAKKDTQLLIFPKEDNEYVLAYRLSLFKGPDYNMIGFIDAQTGEVILSFSNIQTEELTIGRGIGFHGDEYKLPTTDFNGYYWLMDENAARPVRQYTYDWNRGGQYLSFDTDNYWNHDGLLVSAHVNAGRTYDYYFQIFGRQGIDGKNLDIIVNVHWPKLRDNAMWGYDKQIYFGDSGNKDMNMAATLDYMAHEYSHGITQHHSRLEYFAESGALNESFSDIMGTAVEHYWHQKGSGFVKADWFMGEDAYSSFRTRGCRNLANPNTNSQLKNERAPHKWYPDPCHLAQQIPILYNDLGEPIDNGGVHLNMTIYSHAFYLLSQGGTNKVSGLSVNGIGIEKATQIYYRAWVHYLGTKSKFIHAANALYYAARDLYGDGNELAQTNRSMEAIGWTHK